MRDLLLGVHVVRCVVVSLRLPLTSSLVKPPTKYSRGTIRNPIPPTKKFLGTPMRDSSRETVDIWYFLRKGNREIPIQFCLTRSFKYTKYTSQPRHVVVFIPAASLTREERAIEPGPSWARMEEMDHDISVDVDVEEMEIIRLLTAVNTYGSPIAPPGWTRNRSKQHVTLSLWQKCIESNRIEL